MSSVGIFLFLPCLDVSASHNQPDAKYLTLFLCGDVMTGRGIDQVLPYPNDPQLYEPSVRSAKTYVELAEQAHGPIPAPVPFSYIWGDALAELARRTPDLRLINLETSITTSPTYWPTKAIHYRMHPANIPCLMAANIDYCSLANNHTLDWGYAGLTETVETLRKARIQFAGAGRNLQEAVAPATIAIKGKGRVLVFSYGVSTSGIPPSWAALANRPGVNLLSGVSKAAVQIVKGHVKAVKQPGDVAIASIHWGSNWGYTIPPAQRAFAHALIDEGGIDIIHGHSSHHVKGIEVYRGKLILYGCGDFLTDYEGIRGYEEFRWDLAVMYFVTLASSQGTLVRLQMIPLQMRRFRLQRAADTDMRWLRDVLSREGKKLGTWVEVSPENTLLLRWQ